MEAIGKGKTTTGVQIALDLARQAGIPFLMFDPKGEFVRDGLPSGAFADFGKVGAIEVGTDPIPLDFLPRADVQPMKIKRAAMRLRRSTALLRPRDSVQLLCDFRPRGVAAVSVPFHAAVFLGLGVEL